MPLTVLSKLFESTNLSTWLFKNKKFQLQSNNENKYVMCLDANINEAERAKMRKFCDIIGVKYEDVNNFGIVTFEKFVFKKHLPAFIAKNNNDEVVLVIGSENKDSDFSQYEVPVNFENGGYKIGKADLYLKPSINSQGEETGYYVCLIRQGLNDYEMPFLIDKEKAEKTILNPVEYFENGTFADCLKNYQTPRVSNAVYGEYNKIFSEHFGKNTFPDFEGVLLFLKQGKLNRIDKNGQKFVSSSWQYLDSSHPDMVVKVYDKNLNRYEYLSSLTALTFSPTSQPTKWLLDEGLESYAGTIMILTIGVNVTRGELTDTPQHAMAVSVEDYADFGHYQYKNLEESVTRYGKTLPSQSSRDASIDIQPDEDFHSAAYKAPIPGAIGKAILDEFNKPGEAVEQESVKNPVKPPTTKTAKPSPAAIVADSLNKQNSSVAVAVKEVLAETLNHEDLEDDIPF